MKGGINEEGIGGINNGVPDYIDIEAKGGINIGEQGNIDARVQAGYDISTTNNAQSDEVMCGLDFQNDYNQGAQSPKGEPAQAREAREVRDHLLQLLLTKEGASVLQASKVAELLNVSHLKSLLVARGSLEWLTNPNPSNYQHHFYKQAARCLGWCERQGFHLDIPLLLKRVWRDLTSISTNTTLKRNALDSSLKQGKIDKSYLDLVFTLIK